MTDTWSNEHALTIPAPTSRIFEALTTKPALEQWFAEHAQVEPGVGGAFRFWGRHTVGTPAAQDASGAITAFGPDARLGFDWVVSGVPSDVTITLTPEDTDHGSETKVAVRHGLSCRRRPACTRPCRSS